jgi:hypothetical protein
MMVFSGYIERQTIEMLINEEALLFAKYLGDKEKL